jgi:hypothetical protein
MDESTAEQVLGAQRHITAAEDAWHPPMMRN